jgi:hypothetical protein
LRVRAVNDLDLDLILELELELELGLGLEELSLYEKQRDIVKKNLRKLVWGSRVLAFIWSGLDCDAVVDLFRKGTFFPG